MGRVGILAGIGLFAWLSLACSGFGGTVAGTIRLTEAELQPHVGEAFPVTMAENGVEVRLTKPRLRLREGHDKLALDTNLRVKIQEPAIPGVGSLGLKIPELTGKTSVEGDIAYDTNTGTIAFADGALVKFSVDQLPASYQKPVESVVAAAAAKHLKRIDLYTLDASKFEEQAARALIQSVAVKDGALEIAVGFSAK